ncbi:MAG: glycosyltransferase 87 family protein [Thermoanaerobaculia bacterium]|nr:glycosyltransferase 87 family protein [Thermoanaerobaculia bacterium]
MTPVLMPILAVLLFHLAAWWVGGLASKAVGWAGERDPGRWFDRLLLGSVGLALGAGLLATVGLLSPTLLRILTGAMALVGALELYRSGSLRWPRPTWSDSPALCALAFFLVRGLSAFVPLFRHDDLSYHLLLPNLYLEAGGWVVKPELLYANMPHLTEVLYTWPLALGGWVAVPVFVLTVSLWTGVRLWQATEIRAGRVAAGLLVLAILAGPNVQWHLGPSHIEPILAAFVLGAILALIRWRGRDRGSTESADLGRGDRIVMGVFLGFVVASKYTVWPLAALIGVAALVASVPKGRRAWLRMGATLAIVVGVFLAPWLVKAAVTTGNPLYPNFYSVLGGEEWSSVQEFHNHRALQARAGGADPSALDRVAVLWRLPLGDNFYNCPSFSIALMLLFLASVLSWRWRDRASDLTFLIPWSLLGLALWASGFTNGRYLLPWLPVMALATVPLLARLVVRRSAAAAILVVLVGSGAYQFLYQAPGPMAVALPFQLSYREALESNATWGVSQRLREWVPVDGKLLSMWENRWLFLDRDVEADSVYESPRALARLRESDDVSRFSQELADRGVTHVVIHAPQMQLFLEERYAWSIVDPAIYPRHQLDRDRELMQHFVGEELVLLEEYGPWGIFSVRRLRAEAESGTNSGP